MTTNTYKCLSAVMLPGKRDDGLECLFAQRLTEGVLFIEENNNFRQLVAARSLLYRCRVRKVSPSAEIHFGGTDNTSALITFAYSAEVISNSSRKLIFSQTDQNGPMSQFEGNRICHENCGSVTPPLCR